MPSGHGRSNHGEKLTVFNVTGADAVLDDCCATNIFRNWSGQGYILCQSAGLVKNSRFVDMYGPDEAVNITGGTISNCLIKGTIDNYRTGAQAGNGQTSRSMAATLWSRTRGSSKTES